MALITYSVAVRHLKQEGVLDIGSPDEDDADVALKIEQASAIVLIHLKRQGEWEVATNPADDPEFAIVQALVLKVLTWLYRYRGDDDQAPGLDTILNPMTTGMLRDPELA
jgi:hypothetical protein